MESKTQNIAGQVFKFDSAGDALLKEYLANLEKSLANNKDKSEIYDDFKARIAEKLQDKKNEIILAEDVVNLKKEMGDFSEYNELEKPAVGGLAKAGKHTKLIVISAIVFLILLIGSCFVVTYAVAGTNPFTWFLNTSNQMMNWFNNESDQMKEWYEKETDEMNRLYQEGKDNSLKEYNQQVDEMNQDFKNKTDNLKQEFDSGTGRFE